MNSTIFASTIFASIGYMAWVLILLLALATYRTIYNHTNMRNSLKFDPSGQDVSELGQRLTRAHANCYESAIFVVGPMLLAIATDSMAITDGLAMLMLLARILQTVVHILSTSNAAISLRFVLFLVQFGISAYWLVMLGIKFT